MKVAIYARVSTNDQSTQMQTRDLLAYAESRGWKVHKVYEDVGISGSKASRPSLDKMMADAEAKKFDVVLVWRFDRFARSTKHLITALEQFKTLGINFVSHNENIDTSSAVGEMIFTMISGMAQFERRLIQERVVAGLKNAKAKGKKLGRKPKVNDITKARIVSLWDNAQGLSIHKIAQQLDLSAGTVHAVLKESKSAS